MRQKIFREVVGNILIHREYGKAERTQIVIGSTEVTITNASNPFQMGPIDPLKFSPHPKNPKLATVFNELGWVDELGSGVRNIFKYSKYYSGRQPLLEEGSSFRTIIPIPPTSGLYHEKIDLGFLSTLLTGINLRQFELLSRLQPGQTFTLQQYKESLPTSLSATLLKKDIHHLVGEGWLVHIGKTRGSYYTRSNKALPTVANSG